MCSFRFILLIICVVQFSSPQIIQNDDSLTIQNGMLNFASKLNQILHWQNFEDGNIIFSPMNIYAALLLVHLGSNGKSREEVTNILRIDEAGKWPGVHEKFNNIFESLRDNEKGVQPEYSVNITNVIFVDRIILMKKFAAYARTQYDSDIINVNFLNEGFEAVKIINKYIANKVGNHVPKLYTKPQTPYSKVILASCLNFKSGWEFPFRKSTTQRGTFYTTKGPIIVNMMQRVGKMAYADIPTLGAEIGKLVTINNISLFVVLPYKLYSLRYFLDNLISDDIKLMVSKVVDKQFVDFKMPQTVLKSYQNLNETLSQFGAREIFSRQANFTNMIKERYFDVNEVKYMAEVKILENGIESSSVTSVKVSLSAVIEPMSFPTSFHELRNNEVIFFNDILGNFSDLQFYIDRPFFMFVYHHQIQSVLFFGAVNDPNGV